MFLLDFFNKKEDANRDIVRYIRTEWFSDTKHMRDEDVVKFYQHILNERRKRNK